MRIRKRLATGAFVTILVLVVAVAVFKWVWDSRHYHGYDAALPLNVTIRDEKPSPTEKPKYRRIALRFVTTSWTFVYENSTLWVEDEPTDYTSRVSAFRTHMRNSFFILAIDEHGPTSAASGRLSPLDEHTWYTFYG